MKKVLVSVLTFAVMAGFAICAYADKPDAIAFWGIPWLTQESEVIKTIESIDPVSPMDSLFEDTTVDGWYREFTSFYADPAVKNGGVSYHSYKGVNVAGYDVTWLKLDFLYRVVDGCVQRNTGTAEFYKAEYIIDELQDVEGAYNDLYDKLTQLYGMSNNKSRSDLISDMLNPQGALWTAEDGSLVWLAMYYNNSKKTYDEIRIVYAAPNTDELLLKLDTQIKGETVAVEKAEREENAGNFDGL